MGKTAVFIGAGLLVAVIVALIVPMWVMTSGMGMTGAGYGAVFLMIVFCFGLGGGLMFLVFYSARKGHDDAADQGHWRGPDPDA